jgi:hypothetical protein
MPRIDSRNARVVRWRTEAGVRGATAVTIEDKSSYHAESSGAVEHSVRQQSATTGRNRQITQRVCMLCAILANALVSVVRSRLRLLRARSATSRSRLHELEKTSAS